MKSTTRKIIDIIVYFFAFVGFSFTLVFFAMKLGLTKTAGIIDSHSNFVAQVGNEEIIKSNPTEEYSSYPLGNWIKSDEWKVLKKAMEKDSSAINQVAYVIDIPARIIAAQIVAEQLRLFTSERDIFKQVFAPLAVLGTQTQFSLGVTGIKEETAKQIEDHLKDPSSQYYLGDSYAHLLDYPEGASGAQRIARLSNIRDHYYSYLYTALYIKQIEKQWRGALYPIENRPEIISTLFNLGFSKSVPNPNPQIGGASLSINGEGYSFGGLAGEFYYSNELTDIFPKN